MIVLSVHYYRNTVELSHRAHIFSAQRTQLPPESNSVFKDIQRHTNSKIDRLFFRKGVGICSGELFLNAAEELHHPCRIGTDVVLHDLPTRE